MKPFLLSQTIHFLMIVFFVAGCAHKDVYIAEGVQAKGEKIIALDAIRHPWVIEIEKRLRKKGFTVLRLTNSGKSFESQEDGSILAITKTSANYIMYVDAEAYMDAMNRCFGGGFKFVYITVEIIDVQRNQSMASYSNGGYSEDCPPMSGTIYSDIADLADKLWR